MWPNLNGKLELEELISTVRDDRKKGNKVAILVASQNAEAVLKNHLQYLERQTFRKFDVIIVYGTDDQFLSTPRWASIVHIRRRYDVGGAGAFFIGEKFIVKSGYKIMIEADNYCFPTSPNTVKRIVEEIEAGSEIAYPLKTFGITEKLREPRSTRTYFGASTKLLKRAGLVFLPFFMYNDDAEHFLRLSENAQKISAIRDVSVSHEYKSEGDVLVRNSFIYYKTRNDFLFLQQTEKGRKRLGSMFLYILSHMIFTLFLSLQGKKDNSEIIKKGLIDASIGRLGTLELKDPKHKIKKVKDMKFDLLFVPEELKDLYQKEDSYMRSLSMNYSTVYYKRNVSDTSEILKSLMAVRKTNNKRVIFYMVYPTAVIKSFALFTAKEIAVYNNKEFIMIKESRANAEKAKMLIRLPFYFMASLALFFLAIFPKKRMKTLGYGI